MCEREQYESINKEEKLRRPHARTRTHAGTQRWHAAVVALIVVLVKSCSCTLKRES